VVNSKVIEGKGGLNLVCFQIILLVLVSNKIPDEKSGKELVMTHS